jgi:tetratricopeptide (TPR) repeat protein
LAIRWGLVASVVVCGCQSGFDRIAGLVRKPKDDASSRVSVTAHNDSHDDPPGGLASPKQIPQPQLTERDFAGVQLAMGEAFEKEGNLKSAQAAYEAALRNNESSSQAQHRLALVKERRGLGDEALGHLQEAMRLDPDNPQLCCDFGYWYYLRRDWQHAEQHLRRATELDPSFSRAHINLALVLARTGRNEDALRHFARGGLNPAQAYTNLAFVDVTEQNFAQAQLHLNQALAADPELREAKMLLASLSQVAPAAAIDPPAHPSSAAESVATKVRRTPAPTTIR